MSENYLSLDWRNTAPPKDIVHRLEVLFADIDDQTKSGTTLRPSQSSAKRVYSLVQRDGHPVIMRIDNPVSSPNQCQIFQPIMTDCIIEPIVSHNSSKEIP